MITIPVSEGSSSIVADIVAHALSISALVNWTFCFYRGTGGAAPWVVWAQRMDDTGEEFDYVYCAGVTTPPDGYEFVSGPIPSLTGFGVTFKQFGAPPIISQSGRNTGGDVNVSTGALPVIKARVPAVKQTAVTFNIGGAGVNAHNISGAKCVADLWQLMTNTTLQGTPQQTSYLYNSAAGSGEWMAYVITHNINNTAGSPPVVFFYTMGGVATPPTGSRNLAIACPLATFQAINAFNKNAFIPIAQPLSIFTK